MKINPEWKAARYELAYIFHGKKDKRQMSGWRFNEKDYDEMLRLMKHNPNHLYRIAIPKYL